MDVLKNHIVRFVETGINIIRSDDYRSVIQNAFKKHRLIDEIRDPMRQLMAASDNLTLDDVLIEEEGNKSEEDNYQEVKKMKVLHDSDDSDDHSEDENDDGKTKKVNNNVLDRLNNHTPIVKMETILSESILSGSKLSGLVSNPLISDSIAQKKRARASQGLVPSIGHKKTIIPDANSTVPAQKYESIFGTPMPASKSLSVVTPHHSVPLPVAACPILVMRYVHLNDINEYLNGTFLPAN